MARANIRITKLRARLSVARARLDDRTCHCGTCCYVDWPKQIAELEAEIAELEKKELEK